MTNAQGNRENPSAFDDEKHFLWIRYIDGFCERLLSIELFIDLDFQFELTYCTFQSNPINSSGKLPHHICSELIKLTDLDLSSIADQYYIHEGATDFPFYGITVNQYTEVRKFMMGEIPNLSESESQSDNEKTLFRALHVIKMWLIHQTGYKIG